MLLLEQWTRMDQVKFVKMSSVSRGKASNKLQGHQSTGNNEKIYGSFQEVGH